MHLLLEKGFLFDELSILISELLPQNLNLFVLCILPKERMEVVLVYDVERLPLQVNYFGDRVASVQEWILSRVQSRSTCTHRLLLCDKSQVRGRFQLFLDVILLRLKLRILIDDFVDPNIPQFQWLVTSICLEVSSYHHWRLLLDLSADWIWTFQRI